MSLPPASICLKDTSTFYIPIENLNPPAGYCLCPENTGIFDYKSDNTGTMKCTTETIYDGYKFASFTSNAPLIQQNFKFTSTCAPGYVKSSLPGYSNYIKCTATSCPTSWTNVGGSNCERIIDGKTQKIALSTLGYIGIPENTPRYTIPAAKPELKPVVEKDYTELWKILKLVGWIVLGLVCFLLILFILSKLFKSSEPTPVVSSPPVQNTYSQPTQPPAPLVQGGKSKLKSKKISRK